MALFRRRRRPSPPVHVCATTPQELEAEEQRWRAVVAEHGWMVVHVAEDDEAPGFSFTVGLTEHELPEVVAYGLAVEVAHDVLDDLARRLVAGERYADGEVVPDLVKGDYRVQLWTATDLQDPLGAAFRLYGEERVRVRQLVVPDLRDRLPWEDGYALAHLQPQLFTAPDGSGPWRVLIGHADSEGWDLPLDPHLGVLATRWVLDGELPVLLVVHEDSGDWQFLDDVHVPGVDDGSLVCLHHVLDADPTLREPVRQLAPGYESERDEVGGPWRSARSLAG